MRRQDSAPTLAAGLLRLTRDKAGITQSELARRAGVSQQVVSSYETGRMEPTLPSLQRLITAGGYELRVSLEPVGDHDRSLRSFIESLPQDAREEMEHFQQERAEESRMRRVLGL